MSRIISEKDDVFPAKLHCLLENKRFYDILRWSEKNRSFEVLEPRRLVKKVLPVVFNQTQWASFQRQLNIYGFRKVSTKKSIRSYFHPCFRPGRRDLVANVLRVAIKSKAQFLKVDSEEEEYINHENINLGNDAAGSASSLSFANYEQFPPLDGSFYSTDALTLTQGQAAVVFSQSDRFPATYTTDAKGFPVAIASSSRFISNGFSGTYYPIPTQTLPVPANNNQSQPRSVFSNSEYHVPLMLSLESPFLHPASSLSYSQLPPPALVNHARDNHHHDRHSNDHCYYHHHQNEMEEDLGSFLLELLAGEEDADSSSFSLF